MVLIGLAFWPVLGWFITRSLDQSDEPWGLLSLATVIGLLIFQANKQNAVQNYDRGTRDYIAGMLIIIFYIVTYRLTPRLLQSVLLVFALWFFCVERLAMSSRAGIFGLMLLSLPVIPSLNFYAGYPIRYLVSMGTAFWLRGFGVPVIQEGAILSVNKHLIAIDAPCSGIHMLWVEAYAVMVLVSVFSLDFRRSLLLGLAAAVLVPLGNVLRAATLIIYDMIQWRLQTPMMAQYEPLVHVAAGIVYFCLVTVAVALLACKLTSSSKSEVRSEAREVNFLSTSKGDKHFVSDISFTPRIHRFAHLSVISLCIVSAALPFFARPSGGGIKNEPQPVWPAKINGVTVTPVESWKEEQTFAADFPGRMKRFTDGTNAYFVRCVYRDTRQLHPSSDCYRGLGYSIEPRPLMVGNDGYRWSCFEAAKAAQKYLVMERIFDSTGRSWTDVSEWYWAACLGQSNGPWLAITVAEPISN